MEHKEDANQVKYCTTFEAAGATEKGRLTKT